MLIDDDVIDFANREMHNVVLSLDGRKEVHDRCGGPPGTRAATTSSCPSSRSWWRPGAERGYYVRGTFTHNNVDFTEDILHMADLGFTELSMEPVVCAPGEPYALTEEDKPKLYEQYERLAVEMIAGGGRVGPSPSTTI